MTKTEVAEGMEFSSRASNEDAHNKSPSTSVITKSTNLKQRGSERSLQDPNRTNDSASVSKPEVCRSEASKQMRNFASGDTKLGSYETNPQVKTEATFAPQAHAQYRAVVAFPETLFSAWIWVLLKVQIVKLGKPYVCVLGSLLILIDLVPLLNYVSCIGNSTSLDLLTSMHCFIICVISLISFISSLLRSTRQKRILAPKWELFLTRQTKKILKWTTATMSMEFGQNDDRWPPVLALNSARGHPK